MEETKQSQPQQSSQQKTQQNPQREQPTAKAQRQCCKCHLLHAADQIFQCSGQPPSFPAHQLFLCPSCWQDLSSCPTCHTPFPSNNRELRCIVRRMGFLRVQKQIMVVVLATQAIVGKFASKEVKELYKKSMFELCESLRVEYVGILKKEIEMIVGGHFLMESEHDKQDLAVIDGYLKVLKGEGQGTAPEDEAFRNFIKALNQYLQTKILATLMSNPNIMVIQNT